MDFRKLDAKLSEALADTETRGRYEVFVEIAPDLAAKDMDRLAELGVRRRGDTDTVVTARVFARSLCRVTPEVIAVKDLLAPPKT